MKQVFNPYIAGAPLREERGFFGRKDVINRVIQELRNPMTNALVLFGQRRIGKTSLLLQLKHTLPANSFFPVYFDLQDQASHSLGQLLADLADTIAEQAGMQLPDPKDFDDAGYFFRRSFLMELYQTLGDPIRPVLLLDEFDVLDQMTEKKLAEAASAKTFFPFLRRLMTDDPRLAFVFVVGRHAEDLSLDFAATFKSSIAQEIWTLNRQDAEALVRQANTQGTLRFTDQAVERILYLAEGHPYLTQLLCQRIWEQAYNTRTSKPPSIDRTEVEAAIPDVLETGYNALIWVWDGLSAAEKIYASALAETAEEGKIIPENVVIEALADHAARLRAREIEVAPRDLVKRRVLVQVGEREYRFAIELFRRWVRKYKPLRDVKNELDQVDPLAAQLFRTGQEFFNRRQWREAIDEFRDALKINRNHFFARLLLGEALLEIKEIDNAVKEMKSAYELDRAEGTLPLARALISQAKMREAVGNYGGSLASIERALHISPNEREAQKIKQDILAKDPFRNYQIKEVLDHGGIASTLLAYDPNFERNVILKALSNVRVNSKASHKRFEQTAEIIASLEHEAIVPVLDYGVYEEHPYFAMAYIPGLSLQGYLQKVGTLSLSDAALVLTRLSTALDTAHAAGITHCDIRPSNILFDRKKLPYLSDFGFVQVAYQTNSHITIHAPAYAAPEQWQQGKRLGGRVDVYQLAAILFEMLTGQAPFTSDKPAEIKHKKLKGSIPLARAINASLPHSIDLLFSKAMAKNPVERFATLSEFSLAFSRMIAAEKIDRYEIRQRLGEGAISTVYLAYDPAFGRDVAVKIIRAVFSDDRDFRRRFVRELRIIAQLEHSAIVPVYDFGEYEGQAYYVMRYMSGGNLRLRLEEKGPLPLNEASIILKRLAAALDNAHAQKIIHRSIKPSNVLLDSEGLAYLSDFGFANYAEETITSPATVGSPPYMAPEQWRQERIGTFTDVYQLGALLFEMLTGQPPYVAEELSELLYQILHKPLPLAQEINPQLPLAINDVLAKALAKNPAERYVSPSDMVADLHKVIEAENEKKRSKKYLSKAPDKIRQYKIKEVLGASRTSIVYLAQDLIAERTLAIKVLSKTLFDDTMSRKFLEREAEIFSKISRHPAIVPVYDSGQFEGQPFIVMPYMSGGSLDKLLQKNGPVSLLEASKIIRRLADALDTVHSKGIIHRDIKPSNILLDSDGLAYLSDFGIVHHIGQETLDTTIQGTPPYMAPEQWQGKSQNSQTDIYQLGVLLFEMLTGQRPFIADTSAAFVYQHLNEPIPSASDINPQLPPPCDEILRKALAKNPADRFNTAGELASTLENIVEYGGVISLDESKSPPIPKIINERTSSWQWLLVSGVAVVLAISLTLIFLREYPNINLSECLATADAQFALMGPQNNPVFSAAGETIYITSSDILLVEIILDTTRGCSSLSSSVNYEWEAVRGIIKQDADNPSKIIYSSPIDFDEDILSVVLQTSEGNSERVFSSIIRLSP